jgi:hypothetical protein
MSNQSYNNVLTPMGTWSGTTTYKSQVVYGGVANSPMYISCPTVTYSGHVYYATGFTSSGTAKQPTYGTTPDMDTGWQELI